jgi:hypothetical protein
MPTTVVNMKHKPTNYFYIGRGHNSPFGNPFRVGSLQTPKVEDAVFSYYCYLLQKPELLSLLPYLKNQKLACWCKKPDGTGLCHGDVLVYLLDCTLTPELKDLFEAKNIPFDPNTPVR